MDIFWLCHKIQTAKVHILLWKLRVHFGTVSIFYITKTYMNCYNCSSLNSFVWDCNNSSNGSENSIFISLLRKIISVHFGIQSDIGKCTYHSGAKYYIRPFGNYIKSKYCFFMFYNVLNVKEYLSALPRTECGHFTALSALSAAWKLGRKLE